MLFVLVAMLLLGLLITIHEFGHYLAARWMGVAVTKFAVGLGPILWSTTRAGTEWSLRLIPLGGFVETKGSNHFLPGPEEAEPDSYVQAPAWRRLIIVLGGIAANYLSAIAILSLIFMIGSARQDSMQTSTPSETVRWLHVDQNGQTFTSPTIAAIPVATVMTTRGIIYSISSIPEVIERATQTSERTVAGPVGIVEYGSRVTQRGLIDVLRFLWVISIAIVVFNILPIPLLDGGHAVLILMEMVFGRRLNPLLEILFQYVALFLLILFVLYATFVDIRHIFF